MTDWVKYYHTLPYHLRLIAASVHGFRLRLLRYSKDTDAWAADAVARESWTSTMWDEWQMNRLTNMLRHASQNVPYYRRHWQERRRRGDQSPVECLENWPILSKEIVRENPTSFLAQGVDVRSQIEEHTSGTSGKPLTLWMSKEAVRQWYALSEARWRNWYGVSRFHRWGIIGGQLIAPYAQEHPPFWVWNAGMNQLYLSSYHLASKNIPAYLDAIRRHRLLYLLGYASSIYSLARMSLEQNLDVPPMKFIISNAEPLYTHQREIISKAFQCPVYDTYGLSENVCAASECSHGNLHLWPEVGVTEILNENGDATLMPNQVGRIICTGLLNFTMPLVRYEVGDRGVLSSATICACGRTLPILGGIEGRKDDVILTRDGRTIGRLDPVFKADLPISEAQIIQESRERILVRYVPAPGFAQRDANSLSERLRERVGDMEIILEATQQIPRSANGKFRAVISKLQDPSNKREIQ